MGEGWSKKETEEMKVKGDKIDDECLTSTAGLYSFLHTNPKDTRVKTLKKRKFYGLQML